ncbi:MAG TPA: ribose-phosphate pyrophosphokinase [Chryseosolibacter sp.]
MRIFSLLKHHDLAHRVAACLSLKVDPHEDRSFDDGEHKVRPLVSVREEDVYVIDSLYSETGESVHDKLCRLLFFINTLRDSGAKRVTAMLPYLCYTRKDRRTKARDPLTVRYVATLLEAAGLDRIVTMDVHNLQAYQNAFRCRAEHLEAKHLFVNYFRDLLARDEGVVVMSPDIGGVKRAKAFRDKLSAALLRDTGFAFMDKARSRGVVSGDTVVGEVAGKTVLILDDLVNSGTTIARAAAACEQRGASAAYGVVTHGVFIPASNEALAGPALKRMIITNSIQPHHLHESFVKQKLVVLDIAPVCAEAIHRLATGGSLVELTEAEL